MLFKSWDRLFCLVSIPLNIYVLIFYFIYFFVIKIFHFSWIPLFFIVVFVWRKLCCYLYKISNVKTPVRLETTKLVGFLLFFKHSHTRLHMQRTNKGKTPDKRRYKQKRVCRFVCLFVEEKSSRLRVRFDC